jgi:thiol-disulfide isomerase/thioredoxin
VAAALALAGCSPAPAPTPTPTPTPDLAVVNSDRPGEELDLVASLPKDRTVLVEYFSDHCPPCVQFKPLLERLAAARPDLSIRKIDIDRKGSQGIDFDSPLANQYQINRVPLFVIYDKGVFTKKGDEAREQVRAWMEEAGVAR